jgi:hypothetical protein
MTIKIVLNETNNLIFEQTSVSQIGNNQNFHDTSSWRANLSVGLRYTRVEGGPGGYATGRSLRRALAKLERKTTK